MHAPQVAVRHAEPLTEPQAISDCCVQQWATEAETALDHEFAGDAPLRPIGNLASLEDFIR